MIIYQAFWVRMSGPGLIIELLDYFEWNPGVKGRPSVNLNRMHKQNGTSIYVEIHKIILSSVSVYLVIPFQSLRNIKTEEFLVKLGRRVKPTFLRRSRSHTNHEYYAVIWFASVVRSFIFTLQIKIDHCFFAYILDRDLCRSPASYHYS